MRFHTTSIALGLVLALVVGVRAQDVREECLAAYRKGEAFLKQSRLSEAAQAYETAVELAPRAFGENHANTANMVNNLAFIYQRLGQYGKAEPLYRRSLQIREQVFDKEHPTTASSLNSLGELYRVMGRFEDARPRLLRSLKIREAAVPDQPALAMTLNNVGLLYRDLGYYEEALAAYLRALKIYEEKLPSSYPLAVTLDNLAEIQVLLGRIREVERIQQRSLKLFEDNVGADHPDTAICLNNIAFVWHRRLGQLDRAEPHYLRCLQIQRSKLPAQHPSIAQTLTNLAILYQDRGQYARAAEYFLQSQAIRSKLPAGHPAQATSLNDLAYLRDAQGKWEEAEELYRKSLNSRRFKEGEEPPEMAVTLTNLGILYLRQKRYSEAGPLLQQSLALRRARLGPQHPDVAQNYGNLALVHLATQRWEKALDFTDRNLRILRQYEAQVLTTLSEREQLDYLQHHEREWAAGFSLALLRSSDQAVVDKTAEWVLNARGAVQQTLAERALLERAASQPELANLVRDLRATRRQLAALTVQRPTSTDTTQHLARLASLTQQEQELSRQLGQAAGQPARASNWVTLTAVRQQLPPGAVLIELARFAVQDPQTYRWQPARYVAWITPPAGKGLENRVRVIDLGEAKVIEAAVKAAREAITRSADSIRQKGEAEAVKDVHGPLLDLARRVLHPLQEAAGQYKEWVLCPDGLLWLAPWAALPLQEGSLVVEKHLLRHLITGRDLITTRTASKTRDAWLLADPDFDLSPGKVATSAAPLLRGSGTGTSSPLSGQRLSGELRGYRVTFEFLATGEVVIRDAAPGSQELGRGRWRQQGRRLWMETTNWRYVGSYQGQRIQGRRTPVQSGNQTPAEDWHCDLNPELAALLGGDESRSPGTIAERLGKVARLPNTAAEAEAIRPRLKTLLEVEPRVHTEAEASEALVKSIQQPRLLMLSTHGFFLADQDTSPRDREGLVDGPRRDRQRPVLENPLLRCGLLLAGCNKRAEAKEGDEDGVLTGLEIVSQDLRGCQLVVLSACETGVGEVRNGEGVAGLRQAFLLAGVDSVLASLWQVSDRETALLMNEFFGAWNEGKSRAEALRQAQLRRLEARRRQFGAAHPFYWAAFSFTGR